MVLLFDGPETPANELWRLTGEKYDLKQQLSLAVGDMERLPIRRKLAEVEKRINELKEGEQK